MQIFGGLDDLRRKQWLTLRFYFPCDLFGLLFEASYIFVGVTANQMHTMEMEFSELATHPMIFQFALSVKAPLIST